MEKSAAEARRAAIQALLKRERIDDQKQLVSLLHKHFGIVTNQAVVSRDLRRLGVAKRTINEKLVYELPETDINTEILKLAIVNIEYNEALIVITTVPALADFVGDCLDAHMEDLDILGSLSGENVVFVTPRTTKEIAKVYQSICTKMHFIKRPS